LAVFELGLAPAFLAGAALGVPDFLILVFLVAIFSPLWIIINFRL
jgi:hypothetical protein